MSGAGIISYIQLKSEERIIEYFKNKQALSESTAITLDDNIISTILETPFVNEFLSQRKYIIQVPNSNKYYLDVDLYKKEMKKLNLFLLTLAILVLIVIFAFIYLALFVWSK